MNGALGVMHRYMKIDQVVLSFSDKVDVAERNTLHLCIPHSVIDWDRPVLAMLLYVGGTGELVILPDVWLMVWEP